MKLVNLPHSNGAYKDYKDYKKDYNSLDLQIRKSNFRSSIPEAFCKKGVLRNFTKSTGKHLWQSLFFNKVAGHTTLFKKKTLAQLFSCEFCEISKNTFF